VREANDLVESKDLVFSRSITGPSIEKQKQAQLSFANQAVQQSYTSVYFPRSITF